MDWKSARNGKSYKHENIMKARVVM